MLKKETMSDKEIDVKSSSKEHICPDCGAELVPESGCIYCPSAATVNATNCLYSHQFNMDTWTYSPYNKKVKYAESPKRGTGDLFWGESTEW